MFQIKLPPHSSNDSSMESVAYIVNSGMDPAFDSDLVNYLSHIKDKDCSLFFSDSFKGVTRNPQKLSYIIEFVLSHGGSFMTHNYYVGPAYASRRQRLLRRFISVPKSPPN